jgi:hypothetical protein
MMLATIEQVQARGDGGHVEFETVTFTASPVEATKD